VDLQFVPEVKVTATLAEMVALGATVTLLPAFTVDEVILIAAWADVGVMLENIIRSPSGAKSREKSLNISILSSSGFLNTRH